MDEKAIVQTCTNCKYFRRHYVISDRGFLLYTHKGHCANGKIKDSIAVKHVRKDEGCDLWQPYELQKLHIQYGIEQSLQSIDQKVKQILAILRAIE